ncbi:MAG TPA: gamma-glutamyltransferase [Candidatus Binatia bacterium]|jgi:gamma-glutamyltranspeptidase/glutathione hydrolase
MFFRRKIPRLLLFLLFALLAAPVTSGAQQGAVVADNELAVKAGTDILNKGGNAVDAAVATAFALAVVDQSASGLGGGGFMVMYQAKEKKAHALDFRETAPAAANREQYVKNGKPVPSLSLTGALAVAVPGEVAGLVEAQKRFGTMPLPAVMAPAIRLAVEGFTPQVRLRYALERQLHNIRKNPDLARVLLAKDELPSDGEPIRQRELAETLKAIADQGPKVFYEGWIAQAIAERIKKDGGTLTPDDLKNYKPVWREPIIGRYRKWTVLTMPPPSSGGIAVIESLNVLEHYKLGSMPHNSAAYLHLVAESLKHAFADRAQYLGDPDFVQVPTAKLISKDYAAWVRSKISTAKTFAPKYYGLTAYNAEKGGTTHLGVVDKAGNAVSMTLTINTQFGSKILVGETGIVLNNEMDDFAIHPGGANVFGLVGNDANSLQPKKRPLSSMAPTIILENDRPVLVVGGAGGPRIISATLQTILNVLDFRMPLKKALAAPRIHHQWMPDELAVESAIPPLTRKALEKLGHKVQEKNSLGLAEAVAVKGGKAVAQPDPRREEPAAVGERGEHSATPARANGTENRPAQR